MMQFTEKFKKKVLTEAFLYVIQVVLQSININSYQ